MSLINLLRPIEQDNQTVSLLDATLAVAPYSGWDKVNGLSVEATRIKIVDACHKVSSGVADDDTPSTDPPVDAPIANNYVGLEFTGDFSITIVLSIPMDGDVHAILWGVVPMLQDEWQSDNNMLDIEVNVWDESANSANDTATIWWTSSNKNSGNKSGTVDFYSGATAGDPVTVVVSKTGTSYTVTANGKLAGSWTIIASNAIFPNGEVYLGFYADKKANFGYVTSITATAVGTGSTVRRRNMGPPFAVVTEDSLRYQAATNYPDTRIGTCVATYPLAMDRQYAQRLGRDFSNVTPENCMKFQFLQPYQGDFQFNDADLFVNYALQNGMRIHGHNLVWFDSNPAWLTGGTFTAAQVQTIMETHISTVVGRYAGKIAAWDVINEPFKGFTADHHASIWFNAMGANYANLALAAAHAADPDAKLFINEWGCEAPGTKQDALYSLCQSLLDAGAPLHGVGFQMHEDMNDPDFPPGWPQDTGSVTPEQVRTALQRFKALGLEVRVSEMDVNLHVIYSTTVQAQGDYFRDVMAVCVEEGARDFTMWGFTDRWASNQAYYEYYQYGNAVIFDPDYNAKVAYTEMLARLGTPPA